eukprot:TRINITY_DN15348_c0_g1_i1.p1 TRINITY_DN15348_c0_g1~~TRINITY_DN15348_c0_g1_i1.p1  ORF type:complete len:508 (+),score=62.43 TRINITY_DN15348_c0_g1_i1:46-1569(+)
MGSSGSHAFMCTYKPGIGDAADDYGCLRGNPGCTIARRACSVTHKDIDTFLNVAQAEGVIFRSVEIFSESSMTNVGEVHGLLYSYWDFGLRTRVRLDWGQKGLVFNQTAYVDPELVIRSKDCGLAAQTLREQLAEASQRKFCLVGWNSTHFCRHLFHQAGGNWLLNAMVIGLQDIQVNFSSVCIYEALPTQTATCHCVASEPVRGIAYWYTDSGTAQTRGVKLQWVPRGILCDSDVREDGSARGRNLVGVIGRQGSVLADYVTCAEALGKIVVWRQCCTRPGMVIDHLRAVEGHTSEEDTWDCIHFTRCMFTRSLFRGNCRHLFDRLDELAEHSVSFSNIREVILPEKTLPSDPRSTKGSVSCHSVVTLGDSGTLPWEQNQSDRHALVYVYEYLEQTIFLHLGRGGTDFVWFLEAEDILPGSTELRRRVSQHRKRRSTFHARIHAKELKKVIEQLQAEYASSDTSNSWDSEYICDRLFNMTPGITKDMRKDDSIWNPEHMEVHDGDY